MKLRILFPLFSSLFLLGCTQKEATVGTVQKTGSNTFKIQSEEKAPILRLSGNVEAQKHIPVSSKIAGRIDQLFVDVGSRVQAGQILARYSSVENETQIAHQNATQGLRSAESSAQNAIQAAQIAFETEERSYSQVEKEQAAETKRSFDLLFLSTQTNEVTLSNALNFLDQALGVSSRFRGVGLSSEAIGSQDTILKQRVKDQIQLLTKEAQEIKKLNAARPAGNEQIAVLAQKNISLLRAIGTTLSNFDVLVRGSIVSSAFTEDEKQRWQTQTEQFSKKITQATTDLKNNLAQASVQGERSQLQIVAAENRIKNAESQLSLSRATGQTQITNAQSQLNLSANAQNELVIKAPFSGVITKQMVEVGQLVAPGQPFFQLADDSVFKIKTDIPDTAIGQIELGQVSQISMDGIDQIFTGKITKINPAADIQTRKIGIEITLDKQNTNKVLIGLFARITLSLPTQKIFWVPASFVSFDFDGASIKTQDGKVIPINLGPETGGRIEIKFDDISDQIVVKKP